MTLLPILFFLSVPAVTQSPLAPKSVCISESEAKDIAAKALATVGIVREPGQLNPEFERLPWCEFHYRIEFDDIGHVEVTNRGYVRSVFSGIRLPEEKPREQWSEAKLFDRAKALAVKLGVPKGAIAKIEHFDGNMPERLWVTFSLKHRARNVMGAHGTVVLMRDGTFYRYDGTWDYVIETEEPKVSKSEAVALARWILRGHLGSNATSLESVECTYVMPNGRWGGEHYLSTSPSRLRCAWIVSYGRFSAWIDAVTGVLLGGGDGGAGGWGG